MWAKKTSEINFDECINKFSSAAELIELTNDRKNLQNPMRFANIAA